MVISLDFESRSPSSILGKANFFFKIYLYDNKNNIMDDIFKEPLVFIEMHFIDPNSPNSCEIAEVLRTVIHEQENANTENIMNILNNEDNLEFEEDKLSEYVSESEEESDLDENEFLKFFAKPVLHSLPYYIREQPLQTFDEKKIEQDEYSESDDESAAEAVEEEEIKYFGIDKDLDPTRTPLLLNDKTRSKIKEYEKNIHFDDSGAFWRGKSSIPIGKKIGYYEGQVEEDNSNKIIYIKEYNISVSGDKDKWTSYLKKDDLKYNLIMTKNGSFVTVNEIYPFSELIYSSLPISLT